MMRLELATAEYIGARAQQQDLAAAVPLGVGAMLILADGLGGHEGGAEAARIVVDTFKQAGASGLFNAAGTRRQALRETLERANARIAEGANPADGHRGMASTVVAAVVSNDELSWVSVGDSHLYVWRGGRLSKLNEDHSQAGLMVRSGKYHPSDPEVMAVRSVLVSALTGRKLEIVDLPQTTFRLQAGDVLMLASDGLNTLPDTEIESMVGEFRTQGSIKLSTALLERVRSRRVERQDNTTVAVARVLEPVRQEPVEAPRRAIGEAGKAVEPALRKSAGSAPVIDEAALEIRTERITPEPVGKPDQIATEPATIPVPRPVAAAIEADVASEPLPAAATSTSAAGSDPSPVAPLDVKGTAKAAVEQSPVSRAASTPPADVPAARETPVAHEDATAKKPPPNSSPRAESNGRGGAPEGRLAPKPNGARIVPQGWREVEEDAAPPVVPPLLDGKPAARATGFAASKLVRVLVGLLLLWLILGSVAIAAIATLRPEWLSGLVPGFSSPQAPTAPTPAPQEPKAKTVAPEPIVAPVPVPAVRPPSGETTGASDAAAAPKTEPARRPEADQQPAASATSPAAPVPAVGAEATKSGGAAGNSSATGGASPAPPAAPPSAAAPSTPADPPLVEPERPAARPGRAP